MSEEVLRLTRRLERERAARQEAEHLLEAKSLELFQANQALKGLTTDLERQVAERTAELTEALARAEASTRAKSEFLAMMSHEIRTPMTAILGYADLLSEEDYFTKEHSGAIRTIQRNSHHLIELINDILDLSKIEAGRLDIETIACSVPELMEDLRLLMSIRAEAKGIDLELGFDTSIP
ncbi:MAG: hypothetical protein KDA83_22210, partial [Planctomycetales bacterium]|nr:hypothetical protein [Planctomycetales bacterium]